MSYISYPFNSSYPSEQLSALQQAEVYTRQQTSQRIQVAMQTTTIPQCLINKRPLLIYQGGNSTGGQQVPVTSTSFMVADEANSASMFTNVGTSRFLPGLSSADITVTPHTTTSKAVQIDLTGLRTRFNNSSNAYAQSLANYLGTNIANNASNICWYVDILWNVTINGAQSNDWTVYIQEVSSANDASVTAANTRAYACGLSGGGSVTCMTQVQATSALSNLSTTPTKYFTFAIKNNGTGSFIQVWQQSYVTFYVYAALDGVII